VVKRQGSEASAFFLGFISTRFKVPPHSFGVKLSHKMTSIQRKKHQVVEDKDIHPKNFKRKNKEQVES